MRVGNLEVVLAADTRALDTSLRQSEETVKVFGEKSSRQFNRVRGDIEAVGKVMGVSGAQIKAWEDEAKRMLAAASASKALDKVAKSADWSSAEIKKAEQALGLMSKQADRSFSSMGSSADFFKNAMAGAVAAFGAFKAFEFARDTAMAAARFETLGVVMEVVGRNAGISLPTMNAVSVALQKQGIAMNESREATVKLTQAGIDLAKASELGRIAQDAAVIAGTNSSEAFMQLVYAIQSAQPEMLRTIGINVNFEKAYEKLAVTLGTTSAALSEQEKMQARVAATMDGGAAIAGTYEAAMGTAAKQIASFDRYLKDLKTTAGEALQEGLSKSVVMATEKIKDLTAYLKTAEAKDQIAAIGQTGEEAFASLVKAGQSAGSFLLTVGDGWRGLPSIVQEAGLIAAVVGGPKAVAALALLGKAVGEAKGLFSAIGDAWSAEDAARIRDLEDTKKRIQDSWLYTESHKTMKAFEIDKEIAAIKDRRQVLADEKAKLGQVLSQPLGNTVPKSVTTFEDLQAQAKRLFGGASSGLSDETLKANALKEFDARYAMSQRMYAMAQGDPAKMAAAIAVERDAYHALGSELDSIASKHKKDSAAAIQTAKANADATKIINEARGKAMEAQDAFLGDEWAAQARRAATEHQKTLDDLQKKLVDYKGTEKTLMADSLKYWADYEYGIKLAQAAFSKWSSEMKEWGSLMQQIGEATYDPSMVLSGKLTSLQEERARALQAVQGDLEKTNAIVQLYAARETDIQRKAILGRNDLKKKEIEDRLGLEGNFTDYLADRLALNYGLYKDAAAKQTELWSKMADTVIKAFDQVENAFGTVIGASLTDALTGQFKGLQSYIDSLLSSLKQVFISFLADMAKIAMRQYIVIPIVGQMMGTTGNLGSISGLNVPGGDGVSLGDLQTFAKYGASAKDVYSLVSSGASSSSAGVWTPTAGVDYSAGASGTVSGNVVGSSLSSVATSALGAGLGGYTIGSFVRPDNPTASYVGAGVGALAGGLASYTGLGATIGASLGITAGLASTGIGLLAAIPAAIIAGLATPNTTTSSWNTQPGSGKAVMIIGGENIPSSYGVLKQTTSGMFGSSSTTHQAIFQTATGQMAAEENAAWASATNGLTNFISSLNLSSDAIKDATEGFVFPMTAIPEGYEDVVYSNVANAMSEYVLGQLGLKEAIEAVAQEGEVYIDTLTRLSSTMASMVTIAQTAGVSMDQFVGSLDRIAAADFVSRLADAAGGMDALSAAMTRLGTYAYTTEEKLRNSLTATATEAGKSLAALGDGTITMDNFWARFRQAMESGMDPDQMTAWVAASQTMEVWEVSVANARAMETSAMQTQLQAVQQSTAALQQQASVLSQTVEQWGQLSEQMLQLKASLLVNDALSTLSPLEKMNAASARWSTVYGQAQGGNQTAFGQVGTASQDYLTAAAAYFGLGSAEYASIFSGATGQVDALQTMAKSEADYAQQQLDALNVQIEQLTAQSEQMAAQIALAESQVSGLSSVDASVQGTTAAVNNMSAVVSGAISQAMAAANAAQAMALASMGIPRFEAGGDHLGGVRIVGERGPELELTGRSRIFDATTTRRILTRQDSGVDVSGVERRLDALAARLDRLAAIQEQGDGTASEVAAMRTEFRSLRIKLEGQR